MQTINFQCGHCGKLMGVGSDFLGQQVRCPHCQQVVVAPAPTPDAPTEAVPPPSLGLFETIQQAPPSSQDAEDIFAPPEASDDLFGRVDAPRVEFPADPLASTLANDGAARPFDPAPEPTFASTSPYLPPSEAASPPFNGENTVTLPSSGNESPWMAGMATETFAASDAAASPAVESESYTAPEAAVPRSVKRAEPKAPWFLILVFSPLLLYSIVITVFAVMVYQQKVDAEQKVRKRFEIMPDEGDNAGTQKGKKVSRTQYRYEPQLTTQPLPANLIVSFEKDKVEPIRIGDLQITPKRVERKKLSVFVQHHEKPEPCEGDSLVLYLSMKNLSSEYAFAPLDNYFDRFWNGQDQLPPFTQLEAGDKFRFYGGPAKWFPRGDKKHDREWVQGRKAFEADLLEPGEEREFFVCTDGQNKDTVLALFGERNGEKLRPSYKGSFLWRIRVRRGLVNLYDKEYSATAVVGVKFTDKDIQ